MKGNKMNIFAYGTLMDPDIMEHVSGFSRKGKRAVLSGFRRFLVRGEQYPGIVHESGGKVDGILYCDVPPEALRKLDIFEGEMYRREGIRVSLEEGNGTEDAMVYVVKPEYAHLLTEKLWDFESFLAGGKKLFEENYYGFEQLLDS